MPQSVYLIWKVTVQNLACVVFSPIFVADTKLIFGCNFEVHLDYNSIDSFLYNEGIGL